MKKRPLNAVKVISLFLVFLFVFILAGLIIVKNYSDYEKSISGTVTGNDEASVSLIVETADPTPTPTPAPVSGSSSGSSGSGSGSGGGGGGKKVPQFEVDQVLIKVVSKVGETFKKSLTITNPTSETLKIKLLTNLEGIVYLSESEIELGPNQDKTIFLTFVATEDLIPDVYTGKITLESQYSRKEIPVIFEVRSKKSLFDVSLNIPAEYKSLNAGDNVFFQVTLLNLGEIGKVDVELEYTIKDFEGNIIRTLVETVAVETQASFSKVIPLPENIASGDYVVGVRAKYGLSVGIASDVFNIIDRGSISLSPRGQTFIVFGIILIILILLFIIYQLRRSKLKNITANQKKELSQLNKKIASKKIDSSDAEIEIRKLKNQESALEEAYHRDYISKKTYQEGKLRIGYLMGRLKKRL
ncbi:MAG: hypothetical protein Q7S27_02320 [Nanoarchaeota archaeon]|nr:hypothetical protein [Nanoarchaeota archaeon]